MLTPISEQTAKIYTPIDFLDTDRLAISLSERNNFIVNIYGARISEDEYRNSYKFHYSNRWDDEKKEYFYYARPSFPALHDFPLRIPERKRLDDKHHENYRGEKWEFAGTDITASLIYSLWDKDKLNFTEDAKIFYQYLLAISARMSENVKIISQYKAAKEAYERYKNSPECNGRLQELEDALVPINFNLQYCAERPLAPYQQLAAYLQNTNEGFALFMDKGTGKTPCVIANIDNLALQKFEKEGKILKGLIITPNNVRANWESEFQSFSTVEGRVTVLRGSEMNRIKCLIEALSGIENEKYTILVCGYDIVQRFPALFDFTQFPDGDTKWDIVVCDESHYFKDDKTKRWEKGIIKVRDRARRRYPLTGDPVCNNINDLWTQLEFIREGGSGFKNKKNFVDFYSTFDEFSRTTGYQNLPFIQERLAMMSFFISKKEALPDLPEKVYDIIEVEMTSKQQLVYDKIATELQYKIEQELSSGQPDAMTVNNILTQLLRLAQITCGFVTYDAVYSDTGELLRPKRIERFAEQPKMDEVVNILKQQGEKDKALIWCCFKSDILAWQERLTQEGRKFVTFYGETSEAQRKEAEYLFNNDDSVTEFIGNAAAGGTGLNLLGYPPQQPELSDCNVTLEVFYSQNWSAVQRSQAEDRAHRRGTRTNVRIVDPQVPNTIDAEIRKRVVDKRKDASTISDLREILGSVLQNGLRR